MLIWKVIEYVVLGGKVICVYGCIYVDCSLEV